MPRGTRSSKHRRAAANAMSSKVSGVTPAIAAPTLAKSGRRGMAERREAREPIVAPHSALAPQSGERQFEGVGQQCPAALAVCRVGRVDAFEGKPVGPQALQEPVRGAARPQMPGGEMQGERQVSECRGKRRPVRLARWVNSQFPPKLPQGIRFVERVERRLPPDGVSRRLRLTLGR